MKKHSGFTLVELAVTLAVAAILVSLAAPSFRDMLANNRISGTASEFMGTVNLARGEAIKRNALITVASADGTTNWASGWTVRLSASGDTLRSHDSLTGGQSLSGTVSTLQFNGRGALQGGGAPTFDLCDGRSGETGKQIEIERTGRARTSDLAC